MQNIDHTHQMFTPFGGGFVSEDHVHDPPAERSGTWNKWPMILVALLLCATAAAAAVVAAGRTSAPIPELWKQNPPGIYTKAPNSPDFREMLF